MITLITDRLICQTSLVSKIELLAKQNRMDQVILREKDLEDEVLYDLYCKIKKVLMNYDINLIVNAPLGFAHKYDIHQIHLSQDNFRKITSKQSVKQLSFGVSVHTMDEIKSALKLEPNYLLVSPIFKTGCKIGKKPLGIDFLKEIQQLTNVPLVALGGINDHRVNQLITNNFNNVAMRSNLLK